MSKWGTFIQRQQDGELSEHELQRFSELLKSNAEFAKEVELYQSVDQAIQQTLQIAFIRSLGENRTKTLTDAF